MNVKKILVKICCSIIFVVTLTTIVNASNSNFSFILRDSSVNNPSKSTSVTKDDSEQNAYINVSSCDEYSKNSYLVVYDTKNKGFATDTRLLTSSGNKKEPYSEIKGVKNRKYQLWGYTTSKIVIVKGIWCP